MAQAGVLLLNGWGFNWYRAENLLRADDILLRNQADALLGDALSAFRRAEAAFRQRHLAAATRGGQGPDPDRLAELHGFQAMMARLEACRTRLRGASMPPPDRISRPATREAELLDQLGRCDARLAALAQALQIQALQMGMPSISPDGLGEWTALSETHVRTLDEALRERARILGVIQT